jgi:DNA-directed RNA polymerase
MTPRENVRRQLDLEEEALRLGKERYEATRPMPWRSPDDSLKVKDEADLPPGRTLVRLTVEPTARLIREWIAEASTGKAGRRFSALGWLEMAEPEAVAILAARVALNHSAAGKSLQAIELALANQIIGHVEMVNFSKANRPGYAGLQRSLQRISRGSQRRREAIQKLLAKEGATLAIPARERLHLGNLVLDLFVQATGLFTLDEVRRDRGFGHRKVLRPTEATRRWLTEQHGRSSLMQPLLMPMVVRPRRWRSPRSGGYLRPIRGMDILGGAARNRLDALAAADMTDVYEAVNVAQSVPWRINTGVLAVMKEVWDTGGLLGKLPPREDEPLPARPEDIDRNPDSLKTWKRDAAAKHAKNASLASKRFAAQQRLWIAGKFAGEDAFYFPHIMDYRGRLYPLAGGSIHPQSDDAGKALLEFAFAKPLGERGGWWLKVHLANLAGVDKVPFEERVAWTEENAERIIDSARNPLDGARLWDTMEDPWLFLAAAIEFAGYVEQGGAFMSRLPIPLDGSNSGLQHFSALLLDPIGAAAVNVAPSERPQDVYLQVAEVAQRVVDTDLAPEAAAWRGGKVSRKIAKRPTMTFVYAATKYGMTDQVREELDKLDGEGAPYLGGADNFEAAKYLGGVLYGAIGEVVQAAAGGMAWLQQVARVANDSGQNLEWTTPDGFRVIHAYRQTGDEKVPVHWNGKRMELTLRSDSEALNKAEQLAGVAANLIHSYDANHLRAVVREAKREGLGHLALIHDSFGTYAADTDRLASILRRTFVRQYEPDLLAKFRAEVVAQLPPKFAAKVPPAPTRGTFHLSEALTSQFLFA